MRAIQFAVDEFFANRSPAQLGTQAHGQASIGKETKRFRNQQRRGVNQRNITKPECSDQSELA